MGGIVGRYAAIAPRSESNARRLNVVRLFSLASPHQGALASSLNLPHEMMSQVEPDSEFIAWINEADVDHDYVHYCYVRLGDDVVGAENAAPAGATPWWLPNPAFEHAHIAGTLDNRFWADIARRLRGEPAYATVPPAPIPESASRE
jgi:hypothetical protein